MAFFLFEFEPEVGFEPTFIQINGSLYQLAFRVGLRHGFARSIYNLLVSWV